MSQSVYTNKQTGGRRAEGDTSRLAYRFEVDPEAHGQQCQIVAPNGSVVGTAYIEIREPKQHNPKRESKPKPAEAPASYQPGDVLHWIIERRLNRVITCGDCQRWRGWMNAEGWVKCATIHREAILERIENQAEKYGIDYDGVVSELWKWARGGTKYQAEGDND